MKSSSSFFVKSKHSQRMLKRQLLSPKMLEFVPSHQMKLRPASQVRYNCNIGYGLPGLIFAVRDELFSLRCNRCILLKRRLYICDNTQQMSFSLPIELATVSREKIHDLKYFLFFSLGLQYLCYC